MSSVVSWRFSVLGPGGPSLLPAGTRLFDRFWSYRGWWWPALGVAGCGPSLCARLPGLLAMRPCCSVSVGFPRGIRVVVVGGTCRLCWWGGLFGVGGPGGGVVGGGCVWSTAWGWCGWGCTWGRVAVFSVMSRCVGVVVSPGLWLVGGVSWWGPAFGCVGAGGWWGLSVARLIRGAELG